MESYGIDFMEARKINAILQNRIVREIVKILPMIVSNIESIIDVYEL